jgi:3',5'-nucleoside bisphosphate phosphatase
MICCFERAKRSKRAMFTGRENDMHIHTLVSDGREEPLTMMETARRLGLRRISFTDHDAIGAYRHFSPDIFAQARSLGLELLSGIELDSDFRGHETHILGYGFDLDFAPLSNYLEHTQGLRRERVRLQIEIVNRHFGKLVVDPHRVFLPHRDTLMKPHLVHAMLEMGLFTEYPEAARWIGKNAQVPVTVPKLTASEAIALIVEAGGKAVLAHPGYLIKESGIDLHALLAELIPAGLTGLEAEYPYLGTGPHFKTISSEQEMIAAVRRQAAAHHLFTTRGSDAHKPEQLDSFHRPDKNRED